MSRIENTIEKESRLRRSSVTPGQDAQQVPAPRTQPAQPPLRLDHPHLVTSRSSFSPVSEEYKKLKARIMRMTKQEPFRNVLLVTSAVGGEGKSVTAANLALSLARDYDHSVLLVDADTRKPSLPALLNLKPGAGLSDCVADGTDIGSALIKVGNGNLQFLPAGRKNDNPVELFSSQRMRKIISEMKHRYPDRYIIIDTPPVLLFAETKMMSGLVDGIIFVIREGLAPLEHIVEALDLLKDEHLLGVVYNDAGPEGLNGHYPYHSYYHHYDKKK
jgi:exopolysaccharide/PEP-CTERM locus tyrosine autokinase